MAITLFGATSNPADNGSAAGAPLTITPVGSMVAGQLCIVYSVDRAGTSTHSVSNAAGQKWTKTGDGWGELFWCVFNGTWPNDPEFTYTGSVNQTLIMIVFAPTNKSFMWGFEAEVIGTYAAPSSPFTVTITGRTTTHASTVTLASWTSSDDNTWGTLSGSGWDKTGLSAQYRNVAGQDASSTFAYNIQTATATLANVSQNQATLGGDNGGTRIATFYETLILPDVFMVNQSVKRGAFI